MDLSIIAIHAGRSGRDQHHLIFQEITYEDSAYLHVELLFFQWVDFALWGMDHEEFSKVVLVQIVQCLLFYYFEVVVVSFDGPGWILRLFLQNFSDYKFRFGWFGEIGQKLVHNVRDYVSILVFPLNSYANVALLIYFLNILSAHPGFLLLFKTDFIFFFPRRFNVIAGSLSLSFFLDFLRAQLSRYQLFFGTLGVLVEIGGVL